MTALAAWFERQVREQERRVPLVDALLTDRFWPYARYRLRFFFIRYALNALLHVIKVLLLYHLFPRNVFVALVLAHAAISLASSFWWGALEALRERVRVLYRTNRPGALVLAVRHWLRLSAILAAVVLAAAAIGLVWRMREGEAFTPAHLYALALCFRVAVELVVRTLHSGIYAIRRVYKPLSAMLGVDLLTFACLPLLWPLAGAWSFGIATVVSAVATGALSVHYTLRAYRFAGLGPDRPPRAHRMRRPMLPSVRQFLEPGVSWAFMKMDSFLVLGAFAAATAKNGDDLFLLFFVIAPAIQAGFDWAQLFYFDFKQLEGGALRSLRSRYERQLLRLAWVLSLVFWLAAGLTLAVAPGRSLSYWLLLAPFFCSRSLLAVAQIEAFSHRRYARLLLGAVLWLLGFVCVTTALTAPEARLVGLAVVTLGAYAYTRAGSGAEHTSGEHDQPIAFAEWVARVRHHERPLRIRSLKLAPAAGGRGSSGGPRRMHGWRQRGMADRIARCLSQSGAVTSIGADRIAWFETAHVPALRAASLLKRGGGFIERLGDTELYLQGADALSVAWNQGLLGQLSGESAAAVAGPLSQGNLERMFRAMFPNGLVYSLGKSAPAWFTALTAHDRRGIITHAAAFGALGRASRHARFDVTALSDGGALLIVFVVSRRADRRLRSRWTATLLAHNLQHWNHPGLPRAS